MRIETDRYYPTDAPELTIIASRQTLAKWRHQGRGPSYLKSGARVLYKGSDLLTWLDRQRVDTGETAA